MTPYQQLVALSHPSESMTSSAVQFSSMEEYNSWHLKKFGKAP